MYSIQYEILPLILTHSILGAVVTHMGDGEGGYRQFSLSCWFVVLNPNILLQCTNAVLKMYVTLEICQLSKCKCFCQQSLIKEKFKSKFDISYATFKIK